MLENVFPLDQSKSMFEQETPGHNRWHPAIPEAATVRLGTDFRMDCREWTDGQVNNTDDASDIVEPRYSEFLTFIGNSMDDEGNNHYMDTTLAYRQSCLSAIDYLSKLGYTREQAYLLL